MQAGAFIPHDWREWRRMQAWKLRVRGWSRRDIAEALDTAEGSVSRWLSHTSGPEALHARPRSGRPPKLRPHEQRLIPELLWHGPEAWGFRGKVWTSGRVARVIAQEFGVRYHKAHVTRLLKALHWTPQVPITRALQRDEEAIRQWREERWPQLFHEARRERRTLVFVDETGFYLLPGLVKSYAPEGQTPVLREFATRDHLSVMGGMTPGGTLYTLVRQDSLNGLHTVEFLVHLRRVANRRLLVLWDGSPIHRRAEVKQYIEQTHGQVRVEALPGYAPDVDPWDAGAWNHLKHVEMRNLVCLDLEELQEQFYLAIARLRQKPHLIYSFFAQARLTI